MIKSVLTFMRRSMRKGNTLKTKVSLGSFLVGASFGIAILAMIVGIYAYSIRENYIRLRSGPETFYGYSLYDEEYKNFLFVNAPQSFKDFLYAENADNFISYKYDTMDAPYDFVTVGQQMRHHDACAAVVFANDADEALKKGQQIDVLTYVRTDKLDFYYANDYLENILMIYDKDLTAQNGYPQITITKAKINLNGISSSNYDSSIFGIIAVAPLIIFIAILYSVMTAGTNAIAGEKERGTFAAIILSPTPRGSIVTGNVLGISVLGIIPALVVTLIVSMITFFDHHFSLTGLIIALLLIISFAILIASITILISVLNQSVTSAQTAFLPIFLIILGIAVNSIQQLGTFGEYFLYFPLYGHFFGLGNAFAADYNYHNNYILSALICATLSIALSAGIMIFTTKLLYNEKFMTNEGGLSAKDLKKERKPKKSSGIGLLISHALFPVIVLSFVQMLALIPTAISYMRNDIYSDFIVSLKDVSGMMGIVGVMSDILAMFLSSPLFLICMTLGYFVLIFIYCMRIRIFERDRHPLQSMGFIGAHPIRHYLTGLALGFVLLTSVCTILIITGNLEFHGLAVNSSNIWIILSGMPMWFIQGASEEIMFRGYMIPRIEKKFGKIFAVIYSSFLFAALHGANIGFTWLAGINLFIIAVFFALIYLYTESIWLTCAAHTAWNFCQGSLYGLKVSGSDSGASIIASNYTSTAPALFTGGSFGPEGGLAVTIVTAIGIIIISIMLILKHRRCSASTAK